MGKQSFGSMVRDIIAYASFSIFLWAIRMTRDQYWNEIYKAERNRKCIDNPVID